MRFLDLTLPTPEENLALDEALVDRAETTGPAAETFRIWEPAQWFVVLGRTSRRAEEADLERCRAEGIRVLRRSSGGASIVAGPGCLMYAVVLHYLHRPELRMIDRAHRFVLSRLAGALKPLHSDVRPAGTSDLAIDGRKFSGNSLRCKREALVYHGTLLYDMPLTRVGKYLLEPPRQPEYRAGRSHGRFITNFPATREQIVGALRQAWQPICDEQDWPRDRVAELVEQRYGRQEWHDER